MQTAQVRAGLGAQFGNQGPARGMVDGDRLGVTSPSWHRASIKQMVQPFPERVNFGEPQKFVIASSWWPEAQVQIDKRFLGPQP